MSRHAALRLLLLLAALRMPEAEPGVPAIIVFGDSTVDAGNNNRMATLLKGDFLPYGRDFPGGPTGRFSNGRLGTDFYSEAFGLRPFVPAYLDPSYSIRDFAEGVCFASAGSGLDDATAGVLNVIPLTKQLELFTEYRARLAGELGAARAESIISRAVFVVSAGTNDFIENYFIGATPHAYEFDTAEAYADYLVGVARGFVRAIHALGARKVGLTGLAPIGCLPVQRARNYLMECVEEYNAAARDFNTKLEAMAEAATATLPEMKVRVGHVYDLLANMLRNPQLFGYERADVGCCGTGMFEIGLLCNAWNPFTCPDATKYVFWDAVHPTEKTSAIVAGYLFNTTFSKFLN